MIRKVSAEDIAIRRNGTGLEYMCPTWHFVYIFFNPVFQVSTAKNEINLFNNHILIVAPVTFAPAGAMTPSAEFLSTSLLRHMLWVPIWIASTCRCNSNEYPQHMLFIKKIRKKNTQKHHIGLSIIWLFLCWSFFSSPEQKLRMSYCHHPMSVVHRSSSTISLLTH